MKDKNGNGIVVGDYVTWGTPFPNIHSLSGNPVGKIEELEDAWAIDQWIATVRVNNRSLARVDCNLLEKLSDEKAMLLKLAE